MDSNALIQRNIPGPDTTMPPNAGCRYTSSRLWTYAYFKQTFLPQLVVAIKHARFPDLPRANGGFEAAFR